MKPSHIWGIIAGIYAVVFLGFLAFTWEELPNWGEPVKSFAIWGFFFVLIPLGIAGYYSHFKERDKFDWKSIIAPIVFIVVLALIQFLASN